MRRLLLLVACATAFAQPVAAQTMLYVTATGAGGRVDAYRVRGDGSLHPQPAHQRSLGGPKPRRLIARDCKLYVGEQDRVEVFRIRSDGSLEAIGATRKTKRSQMHDFELAPDGRMLYVPIRRDSTIAAYPLDEEGKPSADLITENGLPAGGPTSCVFGPLSADWEDLEIANGKLYAAFSAKVNVYGIDGTGNLVGAARVPRDDDEPLDGIQEGETVCPQYSITPADRAEACIDPEVKPRPDRPDETCTFSSRSRIFGGVGLVVDDKTLIVGERGIHRMTGFTLDDAGNFPYIPTIVENPCAPCTIVGDECVCSKGCKASCSAPGDPFPDAGKRDKKKERKSRKKNRTDEVIRYIGLTLYKPAGGTLVVYGAGYLGRVDSFRLENGTLTKEPGGSTPKDVTSTPVRTAIGATSGGNPVLYVAAGERDRVQMFPLHPGGLIDFNQNPIETDELKGSYPNDVVLTDITACD